jgi:hypothetical protein
MAHNYYHGTDCHQGLPVSTGENVSDVDGTCCGSTGAIRRMFEALGLLESRPAVFDHNDWVRFVEKLSKKSPVVKKVYVR